MNINIHIPNAIEARVLDGIANATNWTVASGITKENWARAQMVLALRNLVVAGETRVANGTSRTQVAALPITV